MNEYGFFTHEASSYEEGVHHIQLAYASYAALLALFEITSLLGVGTRGRRRPRKFAFLNCGSCDWCRRRDLIWGLFSPFNTDASFTAFTLESQRLVT